MARQHLGRVVGDEERLGLGVVDAQLVVCRLASDFEAAVDPLERGADPRSLSDREHHVGAQRAISRRLDDRGLFARLERQGQRRLPARAEIFSIHIDGGAGRIGLHFEQRQRRPQAIERALQLFAIVRGHLVVQDLRVEAPRLVEHLQLLEAAGDVEDDVAVSHQVVGGEKFAERLLDVAGAVERGAAAEAKVGFVGGVIGAGGQRGRERREEGERGKKLRAVFHHVDRFRGERRTLRLRAGLSGAAARLGRRRASGSAEASRRCARTRRRRAARGRAAPSSRRETSSAHFFRPEIRARARVRASNLLAQRSPRGESGIAVVPHEQAERALARFEQRQRRPAIDRAPVLRERSLRSCQQRVPDLARIVALDRATVDQHIERSRPCRSHRLSLLPAKTLSAPL